MRCILLSPFALDLFAAMAKTPELYLDTCPSPLGPIWFASDALGLVRVLIGSRTNLESQLLRRFGPGDLRAGGDHNRTFRRELGEYFSGNLREFETPRHASGTAFQERVWALVCRIPYGATKTYGEIARELGGPRAARAVGHANGRNPLPILIPCHRLVAADGGLRGYCGGVDKKRWLLRWEQNPTSS
ncbi:MAG: methylated-DNA--[protein]-cysteine S-methyltransferase [bacterium]